jgi:hypothetical protein
MRRIKRQKNNCNNPNPNPGSRNNHNNNISILETISCCSYSYQHQGHTTLTRTTRTTTTQWALLLLSPASRRQVWLIAAPTTPACMTIMAVARAAAVASLSSCAAPPTPPNHLQQFPTNNHQPPLIQQWHPTQQPARSLGLQPSDGEQQGAPRPPGRTQQAKPARYPRRGNVVVVHGFWKRGQTCVFDIRITDTKAKS